MQQPCVKSELILFDPSMVQVTMESASWVDYHPLSSIEGFGPIEFHIGGSQDEYLDLNDTELYIKMKVVKSAGGNIDANTKPYTANLALSSLFSDASLTLNETIVEGGHHLYPYKAMLTTLLQFDKGTKETQLRAAGYHDDKVERIKWLAGSKSVEFMGPLYFDLFSQSKYLLPGVDVRVKLIRSKTNFALLNDAGRESIKIVFEEVILYVRRVKVSPSVLAGHEIGLNTSNAIYPIQQSELQSYTIAQGNKGHIQDNLFRGQLPKLVIVGLVDNDAFNGNMVRDGCFFDHFDLNYISLFRDGESCPYSNPLYPDFANGFVLQSYMRMIHGLETFNSNENNGITIDDYIKNGKSIFVFNLAPDLNVSGACGQAYKSANLRLEMKFSKSLPNAINVIIFAIRDGRIEISKERHVFKS